LVDWFYGQIVGFLGNFFALMGNMGVELFELEWVSAIVLFFSRLAWALFTVSVVVCAFECGIEYSTGRGNLQQTALNIIKGFLAVSLFTVVPVRLYALSVSLQGTFSAGLTGYGRSIGEVGQDIITELSEIQTLADVVNSSHFGLGIITSPIMLLFCVILMGYAVLKVFFANLKRGGILLIQIAVGSLYMFSVPRGYLDGFMGWMRQVIGLCLTAFLQSTILVAGLMVFKDHALMGVGLMLSAGEVPRIAGSFGLDTTTKANITSAPDKGPAPGAGGPRNRKSRTHSCPAKFLLFCFLLRAIGNCQQRSVDNNILCWFQEFCQIVLPSHVGHINFIHAYSNPRKLSA